MRHHLVGSIRWYVTMHVLWKDADAEASDRCNESCEDVMQLDADDSRWQWEQHLPHDRQQAQGVCHDIRLTLQQLFSMLQYLPQPIQACWPAVLLGGLLGRWESLVGASSKVAKLGGVLLYVQCILGDQKQHGRCCVCMMMSLACSTSRSACVLCLDAKSCVGTCPTSGTAVYSRWECC